MESISRESISDVAYNLLSNAAMRYSKNYLEKLLNSLKSETSQASKGVILSIVQNIMYAAEEPAPLCQDTGVPTFNVYLNPNISLKGDIRDALTAATIKATDKVPLRKNVIEPFSFKNPGNNTGWGAPYIYFHYSSNPGPMRIRAELKGFGGEWRSTADWVLTSTENMENAVLAYVLNNVLLSKGETCVPGFLGVGVGGYMSEATFNAKNAVFRELNENTLTSPDDTGDNSIRSFEQRIFRCVNNLGIGPMGDGGTTTTLGVYLEKRGTHTSCAPVAVSPICWATRASEALIGEDHIEYLTPHLQKEDVLALREALSQEISRSEKGGKVHELSIPINTEDILKLRVGDIVYVTGTICTARDRAHRKMIEKIQEGKREEIPQEILDNGVIYHCAPVIAKELDGWSIHAAGPTSSSSFTTDEAFLVKNGVSKVVIGKGTMGTDMVNALKGRGVFLEGVGGCAVSYKRMILRNDVKWLDLGYPEAVWIFEVSHFGPLLVGIDSYGNSLTGYVMEDVYENARRIYREEGLDPHKRYIQYPQTFAGLSLEEVIENTKKS